MPVLMIAEDLKTGRSMALDLPDSIGGESALATIYRADTPPSPAVS